MSCPMKEHELETVKLIADGKTASEIASILGMSKWGVQSRIEIIKAKAGVFKDTALVATAFRQGWIQ